DLLRRVGDRGGRRPRRRRQAVWTRAMRRYTADEEQRIRVHAKVREWTRAGFLDAAQARRLDHELGTDLKRTTNLLRAALGLFTAIVVAASVGLVFVSLGIRGETDTAVTLAIAAFACFALAEYLAGSLRLYRYGVEEVLAVSAVVLSSIAALTMVGTRHRSEVHVETVAALVIGAAGALLVYRRFGLIYAGVGAMICAALVPFQLDLGDRAAHLWAAALFAAAFVMARALHRREGDDFPGDEYATLAAAAAAGTDLSLHLHP